MITEPSKKAWSVADELWLALEAMSREKARSIVTSLIAHSPVAVEAAANILADLKRPA